MNLYLKQSNPLSPLNLMRYIRSIMHEQTKRFKWACIVLLLTVSCKSEFNNEFTPDSGQESLTESQAEAESDSIPKYKADISSTDYQTIKGWGVTPAILNTPQGIDVITSNAIQTAIFTDLGINVMRLEIHHSYYTASGELNTALIDQKLVALIQKARAKNPDIKYITTVWSPPASWKTCDPATTKGRCGDVNATPVVPNYLNPEYEDDLIMAMAKVIDYLANTKGLGLPAGHCLQNELMSPVKWDGTVYEPTQYHRIIKNMRAYFNNNGLSEVPLMGPEGGKTTHTLEMLGGAELAYLKADPELNNAINTVINHTYDQWEYPRPSVSELRNFGTNARDTGKELWMTEWCTVAHSNPQNETDMIIAEIEHFSRDIVIGQYNYWLYWLGWRKTFRDIGESMLYANPANPTKAKRYWVYKQLFNSIPPGSVVRHLTTTDPDLQADNSLKIDMVAFDRGSTSVVLLINPTTQTRRMEVNGLEGSSFKQYQSTFTENMADVTPKQAKISNGKGKVYLPAKSIVIITTQE